MKAFLIVPDPSELWLALATNRSPASLLFLDRSLIQHAIESLVSRDVKEIEVIAFVDADRISALVEKGERWGAKIHVTTSRNWSEIRALMVGIANGEAIVVANAERIPDIATVSFDQPGLLFAPNGSTRWAVVAPEAISHVRTLIQGDVPEGWERIEVPASLSASTPAEYLASWNYATGRKMPLMVQTGRDLSAGAIVGRGARIDPTAKIVAPCYIGENTIIGKGCEIGPNAYVNSNCIVEEATQIADSVVLPGSYVGANLDVRQKVVARSSVIDLVRNMVVPVSDDFLFGSTNLANKQGPKGFERVCALVAAVVLSPIGAIGYLAGRFLPLGEREIGYSNPTIDLFCRALPGLLSVAAGKAKFVGAPTLSTRAIQTMQPDVRQALTASPKGIVSETYLLYGPKPTDDDLWASSAFLAAGKTLGSTSQVFKQYLKLALSGRRPNWQS